MEIVISIVLGLLLSAVSIIAIIQINKDIKRAEKETKEENEK